MLTQNFVLKYKFENLFYCLRALKQTEFCRLQYLQLLVSWQYSFMLNSNFIKSNVQLLSHKKIALQLLL